VGLWMADLYRLPFWMWIVVWVTATAISIVLAFWAWFAMAGRYLKQG
jgi:hypothetical protein